MSFGVPGPLLWDTFLSWVLLLSFNTYLSAAAVLSSLLHCGAINNLQECDSDGCGPGFLGAHALLWWTCAA
jgi:hypothetical protein